ncbi:Hint domain-containing protein [Roseomonas sp. OT10]|uniref:Hint domain-containing protein n=1 Tax=Roseomonas cutis TaxID=2897332 RepID=UPI001E3E5DEF|nr:Hint domain-containing protein [Roseomonas sp. OT10]UFN49436.1 Hint domain-containing protein [Roseomonas sp. OT10]
MTQLLDSTLTTLNPGDALTVNLGADVGVPATVLGTSGGGIAVDVLGSTVVFTDVTLNVGDTVIITTEPVTVCFLAGTLVATPTGPRPIETLQAGDLVLTHDGHSAPVVWLGRQTVSTTFADPLSVAPIRIAAGALGEGLPQRDLYVSTDHALLLDGVLVQAGSLVNGSTIARQTALPERFTYYHVELADHALLLAEGVAAETFIDNASRRSFDNWAEHPGDSTLTELPFPRAKSYRQLSSTLRARLAERAAALAPPAQAA